MGEVRNNKTTLPLILSFSHREKDAGIALGACNTSPLPEGEGQGEGLNLWE